MLMRRFRVRPGRLWRWCQDERRGSSGLTQGCRRQRAGYGFAVDPSSGGALVSRRTLLPFLPSASELGSVRLQQVIQRGPNLHALSLHR